MASSKGFFSWLKWPNPGIPSNPTHWIPKTINLMANLPKVPIILVGIYIPSTNSEDSYILWSTWLTGPRNKIPKVCAFLGFIHETRHAKRTLSFDHFVFFLWGEVEERYRRSDWSWGAQRWVGNGWAFVGWTLCSDVWMYRYIYS